MALGDSIVPLGTQTRWGKISAVGCTDGERYYMMVDKYGCVALMPGDVVEAGVWN